MTIPTPPYAALDGVLARTRHLLLDFDQVICQLTTGPSASAAVHQLRGVLTAHEAALPAEISTTTDPLAVLAYAATLGPDLAEQVDIELTNWELGAIPTARPTGYASDAIISARESGRTVTVLSTRSTEVVNAYLERASLTSQITRVAAPASYPPGHLQAHGNLINEAVRRLDAAADACALVTASPAGIGAAHATGVQPIGYAASAGDRGHLADAGPACVILSLADLTLRLRARPRSG